MQSNEVFASMVMTSIADGEHLPLYPARLRSFACVDLTPSGLLFPSGMRSLIDQFGDLVGPLDKVFARNMLLPLFKRALDPEGQAFLEGHCLDAPKMGLPAVVGLNGPRSGWARATAACCPMCIQDDIAPCGNPFWKRDHLVPGLLFCSRHQLPLHVPCEMCADFRKHPNLTTHPGRHCGCGLRPLSQATALSDADMASETEMAKAASNLLQPNYLPQLNHIGFATLVAKSASELGLVEEKGVNWRRTEEYLKDTPHSRLISRTSILLGRVQVGAVLRGKAVFRNPLQGVALLIALYGTWDAVEAECLTAASEERQTAPAKEKENVSLRSTAARNRKWAAKNHDRWFAHYVEAYREVRRMHPDDTFSQLMRRLPRCAGYFLSRANMVAAGEDVPTRFAYDKALDRSFSGHIRATAKRLSDEGYRGRLTQRALTRGHRMDLAWYQIRDRLPLAKLALAECEESEPAYRRRRLMTLCNSATVLKMPQFTKGQINEMDDVAVRKFLKHGVAQ
ncbi:TniQ family protein [Paraburkholderia bryophila]|uniref:TniQ domain-containing protein n=1 Tax=Paraburkholderia bryophila TaxID=420952 RepID=A0A7Z0B6W2_9BURK|nr:TniQ family protein [Paraburkholderia bryophila]NYH21712.1 hypothetical protein [Paraburkholderia bryophila]